ncbi:hypothetical protein [uncultured Aquimarina sp.]|uniref:hypothetical protein n=1 Tax=uncultured Aquimarina sp. TaxID=575652 RepID=UPI00260CB5D3|nr:hypothetical protein [uncultured Aquimarina sp.]
MSLIFADKTEKIITIICILFAIIILLDFSFPGTAYDEKVTKVSKKRQTYYNAGGNSHKSYKLSTENREFDISKEFADNIKKDDIVKTKVSFIFTEVNSYENPITKKKQTYSLRMFTGLILPILLIIILGLGYKFKERMEWPVLILEIMIVVDFIYMCF